MAGVSLRAKLRMKPAVLIVACAAAIAVFGRLASAHLEPEETKATPSARPASSSQRAGGNSYGITQVAYINELVRKGWTEHGLSPSPPASDSEWCRRVFLDILGRIPSTAELDAFLRDRGGQRKLNLVNRLLGEGTVKTDADRQLNEHYTTEYARNWTTIWTNILIGRSGGNEERTMIDREGMQQYLRLSFLRNRTYDKMVHDLVSANGVNKPGEKDANGAVNFLIGKLEENGVQATAKTAQIFLGLQVQCTQCHNHPFNDWKQNQFWQLNAFFRQTRVRRLEGPRGEALVQLFNGDFAGERPDETDKAWIFYDLRSGLVGAALPVFVDGTAIDPHGMVSRVNRRTELANLIVNSEYMPTAMVNRMWGHFLGYGFTKPIDDMGPHNLPTHPELLSRLAGDFRKYSFNIKELIRWITLSEAYSLSSRTHKMNDRDDPSLGEKPQFSKFYLRQMSAEQLYESLIVATEAQNTIGTEEQKERMKNDWLRQFTIAFGTDEGDEATTFNGTIPQVLMMFNGELVRKATNGEAGSFLDRVAKNSKLNYEGKVNYLFYSGLGRKANKAEMQFCESTLLAAHKGDHLKAMQDVFWVVLNSNEFILNH